MDEVPGLQKVLIDTHTFLWMMTEPEKLSAAARAQCETGQLALSVVSIWEIGIKYQIGRLPLPEAPQQFISKHIRHAGIDILPIRYQHAIRAAGLPMLHKDPFDRMIAAQCLEENWPCVTKDGSIQDYGATVIW